MVQVRYRVPMSAPDIGPRERELITEVLQTPCLSIGPYIERFEAAFAAYVGTAHAIGVSSGTGGLHLCMVAAGIGPGDEVITTPFSFVASANCILYERGRPVFVDIDEASLNLDPEQVASAVTERTRALLPVHVFGQPCAMDELLAIARARDLVVVEDACEAVGAEYRGRKVGAFGRAAVFAFYPNKQMTTGEGGIVTTDDDQWANVLRSLRNQGRDEMGTWLHHIRLGYNYRLDELSAALGLAQIERIEELLAKRDAVAAAYAARLRTVAGVEPLQPVPTTTRLSWFVYVVRLAPEIDRDALIARLAEAGVPARPYFASIHLQPFYRERFGYQEGDFPVTERVAASSLALPFHANLSEDQIDYVVRELEAAVLAAAR
jgi:perosamine synthetase